MESERFDALTRRLALSRTRRGAVALLGGILGASLLASSPADAKKNTKKKKATLCLDGQTVQASKKKKKKLLKSGATPGECPPSSPPPPPTGCIPACANKLCGEEDGCGGICGCAAGSVCDAGVCQTCTVVCDGSGLFCGLKLQDALNVGGTVRACPGRYVRNFTITKNTVLVGAGDGDDPSVNTILDANSDGRVVYVIPGVTSELHSLRITGGNSDSTGGGINNQGTLTATGCTITENQAVDGGGIDNRLELTLKDCTVSANKAFVNGGGIFNPSAGLTINDTAITGNTAFLGGGLWTSGTAIFDEESSVTDNTATEPSPSGGGIYQYDGAVILNGVTLSGNEPDQCFGPDCPV